MRLPRTITMLLLSIILAITVGNATSRATTTTPNPVLVLPNPVLYLIGTEPFSKGGVNYIRYNYDVDNKFSYPNDLFAPAPALPPCGLNKNSSRTWVDIFDQRGKRLYGFCAFSKASDLGSLWFALEDDVVPPSYIYIEINDRQTNTKYKSNLAGTNWMTEKVISMMPSKVGIISRIRLSR